MDSPSNTVTTRLSLGKRWGYSVGHVLNDLCASMWFSYFILYFHKIALFSSSDAGALLLIGQVADALATPFVGIESDRTGAIKYGKRKIWHLFGTFAVACAFPFIFNLCVFGCADAPSWNLFIYYAPFIVLFQFGWAATQISHLALIPELTCDEKERVELNAMRYGFTVSSSVFVYVLNWLLLSVNQSSSALGPKDASKFQILAFTVVAVGLGFVSIFHFTTKERDRPCPIPNSISVCKNRNHSSGWSLWFKDIQFYQVGAIYMMTRLVVNLSQVYIPMFVIETLKLNKTAIALVPLVVYISGIFASLFSRPLNHYLGMKECAECALSTSLLLFSKNLTTNVFYLALFQWTYFLGLVLTLAASGWLWMLDHLTFRNRYEVYGCAVLIGLGGSTLLINSLAFVSQMIGKKTETGAFVYGAMSFLDKLSNGAAVMVIQLMHPCKASIGCCPMCQEFYHEVMVFVPSGAAVLAFLVLLTLIGSEIGGPAEPDESKSPLLKNDNTSAYGALDGGREFLNPVEDPLCIEDASASVNAMLRDQDELHDDYEERNPIA